MPITTGRRRYRAAAALLVTGLTVTGLAACTPTPAPSSSPSDSPSPSPSPSLSASPSPSASPADSEGAPIEASCLDLVSLQAMYDFDPNFALLDEHTPATGSPAATAVAEDGIACNWLQQSNSETIEIAVAQPSSARLAELRAAAGVAPDTNAEVFVMRAGKGEIQSFTITHWMVLTSSYFSSVEDARPLIDSVSAALG